MAFKWWLRIHIDTTIELQLRRGDGTLDITHDTLVKSKGISSCPELGSGIGAAHLPDKDEGPAPTHFDDSGHTAVGQMRVDNVQETQARLQSVEKCP
jgi:hypothetical protein